MERRDLFRQTGAFLAAASTLAIPLMAENALAAAVPDSSDTTISLAPGAGPIPPLPPIDAKIDRITGVYAGTRPFRHQGPRIELERLGRKVIVHNYGHGGAGWSLSWGSSKLALDLALTTGERRLAIIGCGALGLTSALLAQRAGLLVRIYAKALPPDVSSISATGLWTPDSRFCSAEHAPAQATRWKEMATTSFAAYQNLMGLPGKPIEWITGYALSDTPFTTRPSPIPDEPEYGELRDRQNDFTPQPVAIERGSHPFPTPFVRRWTTMMFNVSAYAHLLMADFLRAGGKVQVCEFKHPRELQKLPERTIINATGYGARALFDDKSVIPVRGQTARLVPQPEVTYGLSTKQFLVVPRSDGLLVQDIDETGNFNNADESPSRSESERTVRQLAALTANFRK